MMRAPEAPPARVSVGLRLRPQVHAALARAAEEDGVSINAWVVTVVLRELQRRPAPA